MSDPTRTARRTVLAAGAVALTGGALTACGTSSEKPASEAGTGSTPQDAGSSAGGAALVKSSSVPVGGGTVLKEQKLVVTQPTAGSFRCFTAVCPHQGCLVNKVENGSIDCPCHGSKFEITDGAVTKGPAATGLAEKKIVVSPGGEISLA
ncbi:Rieske (2Fe-2S) protein [Streptomyces sp. H27-H5]|uniref:Rieske (2Fe-2S) protein n=1 Tax=Streptomyces sp. H27-H5 TaxID=2996460 RepID=UPI00226FF9AE|nr:Rieske (2Fe-2S) protein [Streptomyces sp. H27-H5]MCY0961398.1 Rieske (2Fe-2S) protein [Streptomyces sp. H27-H5]